MAKIVLSTIDDPTAASRLARQLVAERLTACVNIIPNIASVYKWKGAVEEASEALLIMKTSDDCLDRLIRRIRELHPYEVPEAISVSVDSGLSRYLEWINTETGAEK